MGTAEVCVLAYYASTAIVVSTRAYHGKFCPLSTAQKPSPELAGEFIPGYMYLGIPVARLAGLSEWTWRQGPRCDLILIRGDVLL